MDQQAEDETATKRSILFRIGPGYLSYWEHIATHHCALDHRQSRALLTLHQSLYQLMEHRNAIETARRAAIPVSTLDHRELPSTSVQQEIFSATKNYFLSFYSSVSAIAGVVKRFSDVFGEAPQHSNERFLEWLAEIALFKDHWPLLRAARDFRTLVDHPASKQPYTWGTIDDDNGHLRAMLHGPSGFAGNIPSGAARRKPSMRLREDDDWFFVAPNEDEVLAMLCIQLNALVPRIESQQPNKDALPCDWTPSVTDDDPIEGYPLLAIGAGTIVSSGPMAPEISQEDQLKIDAILAPYAEKIRRDRWGRNSAEPEDP